MPDLDRILEREGHSVDLGPDAYGNLLRRRERKQRRQRITAAVVVVLLIGGLLAAALAAGQQVERQPATPDLTGATVSSLQELWSYDTAAVAAPPAAGDGIVVTVTKAGTMLAFPVPCQTTDDSCQPLWRADVGRMLTTQDPLNDLPGPVWLDSVGPPNGPSPGRGAVIVDGTVYTVARDGTLYAFATTCAAGGGTCTPLWTAHVDASQNTLPQEMDGTVYLGTARYVYAFRGCPIDGSECAPAWRVRGESFLRAQDGAVYDTITQRGLVASLDPQTGATIWTGGPGAAVAGTCCGNWPVPVRFGDTVYVSFGTELDAFPASCSGRCDPAWIGEIPDPYYNGPVVTDGGVTLTVATDGLTSGLLTFPVDCRSDGGTCTAFHRTDVGSELTTVGPVIADDTLIAASSRAGDVYAFDPACLVSQDACPQLWMAFVLTPDQPVQAADVVFVADLGTGPLRAFPIACENQPPPESPSSPSRCLPLWESDYEPAGSPAVLDGVVFATDVDGVVHASGLVPGSAGLPGTSDDRPKAPVPLLVMIGVCAVIGAWTLLRRRRTPR